MRIRAVLILFLSILAFTIGCRNALSPNVDRDKPPETWLTAAPMDTLAPKNRSGGRDPAEIHTIPFRFHMYWAGADDDGTVVGYYWAVVDTLPLPPEGSNVVPPLPGPRASQYHFTTKTDSIFTFKVSEFSPDRQHAFYVYAVDDKGKADPTPARFIFNALDRFPPAVVFDQSIGTGTIWRVKMRGIATSTDTVITIRDTTAVQSPPPTDTIPSGSRIDFCWHSLPTLPGQVAVMYKYKLEEPTFVPVDSSIHCVSYNTGIGSDKLRAGTKYFFLEAIDAAGGTRQIPFTRRFQLNFNPDTWFAGPDTNIVPAQTDPSDRQPHRFLDIASWRSVPPLPGTMLSCDSLVLWPTERIQRRTFWEIYGDRLYVHGEGDTVNTNSWIIISSGGSDVDSPYLVDIKPNDPVNTAGCTGGETLRAIIPTTDRVGSPVAFQIQHTDALDPREENLSFGSPSAQYPTFDAASTQESPFINGYVNLNQSGKVYMVVRAIDGDGAIDDRIVSPIFAKTLADKVDAGLGSPAEEALRTRILTFYVNRAPFFNFDSPQFFPKPPEYNGHVTASSPDRILHLNIIGTDPDPFDRTAIPPPKPGGPSALTVLRTTVTVHGTYTSGGVTRDTIYTGPNVFTTQQTIDLTPGGPAGYITGTHLTLDVQLCDCAHCESDVGAGRCIVASIPVEVPPPSGAAATSSNRPTGTNRLAPSGRSYAP